MKKFINLFQFLTRITLKKDIEMVDDMGETLVYFPVVGTCIGIILYMATIFLNYILGQGLHLLSGVLIVLLEAVITGGLHIDGFGDTFDGLFSYRPKDKILEIMKDPTMGTNGVLSIVFLIISKIILVDLAITNNMEIIIFQMPIISRLMPVVLSYKTMSARKNGMGELFIGKCSKKVFIISTFYSLITVFISSILFNLNTIFIGITRMENFISIVVDYNNFIFSIITVFVSLFLIIFILTVFKNGVYKKIGGLTGDILGCSVELTELMYIFIIVVMSVRFGIV